MRSVRRQRLRRGTVKWSQVGLHLGIAILLLLSFIPIYLMVAISFKNPVQYNWERWTISFPLRLTNYAAAWEIIRYYLWNTVFVAVVQTAGTLILSLVSGYVFARMRFPFKETLYYAIIALLMVPWVLSFIPSYMLYWRMGLLNSPWVIIIPGIAGGQVFGIFLMRAVIAGIPGELFEAARCDGGNTWTLIWQITLPLSMPGLATLAVLRVLSAWNAFLWPMVTLSDPRKQLISVGLYSISGGFFPQWGPLFAGYVIASLPLVALFILLGKFYVEGLVGSGLKV